MKPIHETLRDDLFEKTVHLYVCSPEQLESYDVVPSDQIDKDAIAMAFHLHGGAVMWLKAYDGAEYLRSLVHEAVHVAVYLMSTSGVPQGEDDNEMIARYTEYLVGAFVDYLPAKSRTRS
jgi:hypothetical protein